MIFDNAIDRSKTNSVKWNRSSIESISANENALPFWVADMDFPPEPHIKAKAEELSSLGVYGYPVFNDFTSIASSWLEKKHSWNVEDDSILYTMGLLHGIALAINLFTKPGDKILIPSPTYRPFRLLAERNNRIMIDHELGYNSGVFFLDRERFSKDTEDASMILFCSPHNPSGLVFSKEDLEFILKIAKDKNIPIVSDEIHADLVHDGSLHIPMGKANEDINANCITFMAPSKTFNVAGEHSAIAIFSNSDMLAKFKDAQLSLWVNEPGYLIGELTQEAYKNGLKYNKELCSYLTQNAEFIRNYLEQNCPDIVLVNTSASFVSFLDCSLIYNKIEKHVEANPTRYEGGKGGGLLSRFFGVEAGVAMNDGTWFGEQYKNFVRFNYGTSRSRIEDALEKIASAVNDL